MTTIAILGSGNVARALTGRLRAAGHEVVIGSRDPRRAATGWGRDGDGAVGFTDLADAARPAEVVVNATPGASSLEILRGLAAALSGKVLLDVANAVEIGPDGFATSLRYPNGGLAEEIQRALPETKVVKALNTMNDAVMADPTGLSTPVSVFVSGDDAVAKAVVTGLLVDMGWPPEWIIDLGGVATAWWPERFVLMVRPLVAALGPVPFGLAIAR